MLKLKGYQKRYLRASAHRLKPGIFIGKQGLSAMVYFAIDQALEHNELLKVKFLEFKDKDSKLHIAASIEHNVGCHLVGVTGHTALFYRPHKQPGKRRLILPRR